MKRVLSFILTLVVFASFTTSAYATSFVDAKTTKWIFTNKMSEVNRNLQNNYSGQYGLLYNLYHITVQTIWTRAALGTETLALSEREKGEYLGQLKENISSFNKRFKSAPESASDATFTPMKTKLVGEVGSNENAEQIFIANLLGTESTTSAVLEYMDLVLSNIDKAAKAGPNGVTYKQEDEPYKKVVELHKEELRYTYRILNALMHEYIYIEGITDPKDENFKELALTSPDAGKLINNTEYAALIQQGRDVYQEANNTLGNVEVKDKAPYLEQFAHVKRAEGASSSDDGGSSWTPSEAVKDGKIHLTPLYASILAASAVYVPFSSHLGDQPFLNALKGITGPEYPKVMSIYNDLKERKKPLFIVKGGKFKEGEAISGESDVVSVNDLLEAVEENMNMVVYTVKNQFGPLPGDNNSFGFYTDQDFYNKIRNDKPSLFNQTEKTSTTQGTENSDANKSSALSHSGSAVVKVFINGSKVVSNQNTPPILGFDRDWKNKLGFAVITNILKSTKKSESFKTDYLFMNAFGDIVLADNTVIIPGSANPYMYYKSAYPVYTSAYMNSYPKVLPKGSESFKVMPADVGKFVAMSSVEDNKVSDKGDKDKNEVGSGEMGEGLKNWFFADVDNPQPFFVKMKSESTAAYMKDDVRADSALINRFYGINGNAGYNFLLTNSGYSVSKSFWGKLNIFNNITDKVHALKVVQYRPSVSEYSIFPFNPEEDPEGKLATLIGQNMFWTYTLRGGEGAASLSGVLDEEFIFNNILVEGLNGSVYSNSYRKNLVQDYEAIIKDGGMYGFKNTIKNIVESTLNNLGSTDGVLGIKSRYEDPLLAKLLQLCSDYMWYIVMGLFIIFIAKYLRQRTNIVYTLFSSIAAVVIAYSMLFIVPVYIPMLYNMVAGQITKTYAYDILTTKAERYSDTYGDSGRVDKKGNFVNSSSSINLYKMTEKDMHQLSNSMDISVRDLKMGKSAIIDPDAGIYAQGDIIKVSTGRLMYQNPIVGKYKDVGGLSVYQLQGEKMYSSAIDYYTPYFLITDGFIETLNKFLQLYDVPRSVAKYSGGLTKDSFAVYNYLYSEPFLTPGEYSTEDNLATPEQIEKMKDVFGKETAEDFLGIRNILSMKSEQVQQTLWYKTLLQNGYLGSDPEATNKREGLIRYVNYQTKKFIFDLDTPQGFVSDENMIKIISLYATTAFNGRVSEMFNYMHPLFLNFADIPLDDVLSETLIRDQDKFLSEKMNLASYVVNDVNVFTSGFFIVSVTMDFLQNKIISYSIPILYILLMILLLYNFVSGKRSRAAIKGYVKASAVIYFCFVGQTLVHYLAKFANTTWAIYIMLICFSLFMWMLFIMLSSVLLNFTEIGNGKMDAYVRGIKTRLGKINDNLKVSTTSLTHSVKDAYRTASQEDSKYSNERDVDDVSNYNPTINTSASYRGRYRGTRN